MIIYLAGSTAVGKSEVAVAMARHVGGEVISVDSMQVYQGFDIGTGKLTAGEQAGIPHHLLNVVPLTGQFDAARFLRLAQEAQAEILSRAKTPIFCGGTGLYFNALHAGIGSGPPSDPEMRRELGRHSLEFLLGKLEKIDPASYMTIDRQNPRRVLRALEIALLTGKSASTLRADWSKPAPGPDEFWFGLARGMEDLRARINARVDRMFANGLVAETRELIALGLEQNSAAMQAIGYRQVVEHLHGARSIVETIELVKQKTRQYAKRQMTWFRRQLNLDWIQLDPMESADATAQKILERVQARPNHPPQFEQSRSNPRA